MRPNSACFGAAQSLFERLVRACPYPLADYERNGRYTGFPSMGVEWQKMESPVLRQALGMQARCPAGRREKETIIISLGHSRGTLLCCALHPAEP